MQSNLPPMEVIPNPRAYQEQSIDQLDSERLEVQNRLIRNWDINIATLIAKIKKNNFRDPEAFHRAIHSFETIILEKIDTIYPEPQERATAKSHFLYITANLLHRTDYSEDGWPVIPNIAQSLGATSNSNLS